MDRYKRTTVKGLAGSVFVASLPPAESATRSSSLHRSNPPDWVSNYDVIWTKPSRNSGESMPCGAGDIGLNVWAEGAELLFYISRSGAFDETNSYLKLGRVRLSFDPPPAPDDPTFRQHLRLVDGEVIFAWDGMEIVLWADVEQPIVHVSVLGERPLKITATFESWRLQDRDYLPAEMSMHRAYDGAPVTPRQYADEVSFAEGGVLSVHRNRDDHTVFDLLVEQQGLQAVKHQLFNPLRGLAFGCLMHGRGLSAAGRTSGRYASTSFEGWSLASRQPRTRHHLQVVCQVSQAESANDWLASLRRLRATADGAKLSRERSRRWWRAYWSRSRIVIEPGEPKPESQRWRIGRNYQLFRHQLGTNARGLWPTKFNGGNFTFDPEFVVQDKRLTPDFRAWGGGEFTAQNQRLIAWPMLKSGDIDLMRPQLNFYRRLKRTAELRTETYWKHRGACFVEQIENFGLCCGQEYGWKRTWERPAALLPGVEDSAFVDYLWDTVLEFCLMMLEVYRFSGILKPGDLEFIDSCLTFFDEHYRAEYRRVSGREVDDGRKLVLYPGTACETYKTALNSTVTIAGLDAVLNALLNLPETILTSGLRVRYEAMRDSIPPIATRTMSDRRVIAPAALWDRIQNVEIPQLYPVFPYGQYGVGLPDIELAIDTWRYGVDTAQQKDIKSWHQDAIFCARLGLTEEAAKLTAAKLDDASHRYPTFWGPGHDWTPDHNWGGSGMIGLQEMLMQTPGDAIHLFPAWPRDWDVDFCLHAPRKTQVAATLKNGRLTKLVVEPPQAEGRIVFPSWLNDY